ncbi:polyprenyl synthetase family protein [Risungbinella massiliensis]|uniref:polyprenyl synthetase family protein n=1 Tax=Risungbinella massiliensis TaxID=1329796 RepID=UPI0005CBCEDC|nr:farnesyl diphosphate synthase [Risungbinella massiliensis]
MIQSYIKEQAQLIHNTLDKKTQDLPGVPDHLRESMRYSLLAGGKRIRPVLTLATVEALGQDPEKALEIACAIEMIHTYSLIHDDLPAMDDDDYRRGKPTNHKVFGEATAILAGDALLTEAFGWMAQGSAKAGLSSRVMAQLFREASNMAGIYGMVGGQLSDMEAEKRQVGLAELESIHQRKTGALIAFAVRAGALVGGANENLLEALTEYAYHLGLAFQIQDDILDVVGDQEKLGKPIGSDQDNGKSTYPALLGLEGAIEKLKITSQQAVDAIGTRSDLNPTKLVEIVDYLLHRDQ